MSVLPEVATWSCDRVIDDLPYYDEAVRGTVRDAICAETPDTTVAVGSIWEQLPTSIRLKILHAHFCKNMGVPNTMSPKITLWEYATGLWDYLYPLQQNI